jgi:ABC-type amino acid transport system permease subunit
LFGYRTIGSAAALTDFIVFLAAYAAQDLLTGLRSVSRSVIEAGAALGLSRFQVIRLVILPLGARIAVPALFGQYVRMFKYTSVASALGATELKCCWSIRGCSSPCCCSPPRRRSIRSCASPYRCSAAGCICA